MSARRRRGRGAANRREISKRQEDKAAVKRPKKIVLMTRQDVTRFQLRDCRRKGVNRVRAGDADDGEIDGRGIERDRLIPAAAGVDEDTFPADFDEKGERIAKHPVVDLARRQMFGGPLNGVTPKTRSCAAGRTRMSAPFTRIVEPALTLRVGFAGRPADWASCTLVAEAINLAPVARAIGGTS